MPTWSIKVIGKVQGVWFRASTRQKALELGLCGWVRNEADGSVHIEVQGSTEQLEAFKDWCGEGPVHARVDEVKVLEIEDKVLGSGFEIVRKFPPLAGD